VIEKSLAVGLGGMLATDVQMALSVRRPRVYTVIAGLGGRAITKLSLLKLFQQALADALESVTFLDLSWDIVNRHLARELATRRSGPAAEGILKDLGTLSSKVV
jgi:pyruvate ferredoxin oxidoreductase alpha subunit